MPEKTRLESDSMGAIEVRADRYWGAQTERSLQHFRIGDDRMPVAAATAVVRHVVPSVAALRDALRAKSGEFADIVKIGRTHLQDAVPLTLGQEFSGWVAQLDGGIRHLETTLPGLLALAIGGTALRPRLHAPPRLGEAGGAETRPGARAPVAPAGGKKR